VPISDWFGEDFSSIDNRIKSYDLLGKFVDQIENFYPGSTEQHVLDLREELSKLDNTEFAFLICHSGYIPEHYPPDSSNETLYSKLVELLVQDWAIRLDFTESELPSQKSSKEDITIKDEEVVIVCDAKSFRLGRSQPAPNVKDVLKHADIEKWLSAYSDMKACGGLVTFPRQLDWKSGSDFYQYTTDHSSPTMCLFYEHLAFFLLKRLPKERIISAYANYKTLFPEKVSKSMRNRDIYYDTIERYLFSDCLDEWIHFNSLSIQISKERAFHAHKTLDAMIEDIKCAIKTKYNQIDDIQYLREAVVESEVAGATENLQKQKERIIKFRDVSKDYINE